MPWLTESVFTEGAGEGVLSVPLVETGERDRCVRFVHVVNPFRSPVGDANDRIQALSYESMRRARAFSGDFPVHLAAVVAEGEVECVPEGFDLAGTLTRTVSDIARFAVPSELPLLFDVLEAGCGYASQVANTHACEEEAIAVVFTNVDICLQPYFYLAVADVMSRGFDTLTINRRSIPPIDPDPARLASMYAEFGGDHDGFDCFVFSLRNVSNFVRSDACVGRDFVMRSLLYNLVANSTRMAMLRRAHLTFHLGGLGEWTDPKYKDYRQFNVEQARHVLTTLAARNPSTERKLAQFCERHGEPFRFTAQQSKPGV